MSALKTDLLVIGAGPGGLSVAAGAVQMGAKVVLLEGSKMGGDCLNYGCLPSKALIAAGHAAHSRTGTSAFGVANAVPDVDYSAAKDHVHRAIDSIKPHDSQERFENLGVTVIREYGAFLSPTQVKAGETVITARRIVIATGSRTFVPPIPGLDTVPYETNETLFDLRQKPDHLLVIGGGPIGLEMAQAHARLGSKVTVIEGAKALGQNDPELAAVVLEQMRAEGIEIVEGVMAAEIRGQAGAIEVVTKDEQSFRGTHLLIAVGRKPNIERLALDNAGIATTKNGIKVDAGLRTTNRRVYAIGDVSGGPQFTHVAGYHAGVIIRSALFGMPSKARTDHIPHVTYTDPELAQVGLTEAQAKSEYGGKTEVVRFDFAQVDRAVTDLKKTGFIKIMVVRGRPVGASIVGHQAGEHIGFWILAITNRLKMSQIAGTIAPYPTMGEINKRVVGAYFSPRLFDNPKIKKIVGLVQNWLP